MDLLGTRKTTLGRKPKVSLSQDGVLGGGRLQMVWRGGQNDPTPFNPPRILLGLGAPPRRRPQHTRLLERGRTTTTGNKQEAGTMNFESSCRRLELPLIQI